MSSERIEYVFEVPKESSVSVQVLHSPDGHLVRIEPQGVEGGYLFGRHDVDQPSGGGEGGVVPEGGAPSREGVEAEGD
ncbi:hypothetical protein [Streptomyces flavofungini]|uniref:hypothetical protein n=1 Tax=Streptomyces flavofungini TaxID=68200 RepID=UPI0025B224D2|nr:hypothetical protein [Streptomyces flavofungini]WJV48486.1 hypothetical protein QUY26_24970 [Streptomyces flavofungini]